MLKRIQKMNIENNIVLGSSRSKYIGKPLSMNLSNFSVAGSNLFDYQIIFNEILKKKSSFDTVFIEIPPWIFNVNSDDRYTLFNQDYSFFKKAKRMMSYNYFIDNINSIINTNISTDSTSYIYFKDGSHKIPYHLRNNAGNTLSFIEEAKAGESLLNNFEKIDQDLVARLISFLNTVNKHSNNTVLILFPSPPSTYSIISNKYLLINDTEQLIIKISDSLLLKTKGSFNPFNIVDLKDKDFYDQLHPNEAGTFKIISN